MITFAKEALQNIRQTGSIIESSSFLCRKMTSAIDFSKELNMVELGAGTGKMTKWILSQMSKSSSLMSFEVNSSLFTQLSGIEDDRLHAINRTAGDLRVFQQNSTVDYIISGLPLANIDQEEKSRFIYDCYKALKPGGYFIQFQYSLNDFSMIKNRFKMVNLGFTFFNFPPAFVYYAIKTAK